jgi:hypothetical protein
MKPLTSGQLRNRIRWRRSGIKGQLKRIEKSFQSIEATNILIPTERFKVQHILQLVKALQLLWIPNYEQNLTELSLREYERQLKPNNKRKTKKSNRPRTRA